MALVATESPHSHGAVTDCAPSIDPRNRLTAPSDMAHSDVSLKRTTACRQELCSKFSPDGQQNRM